MAKPNNIPMPVHTHCSAPKFDGEASLLPNFFCEIEQLAEASKITDKATIEWAIRYTPLKVTDLWENQPAAAGTNWTSFKTEIYDLYPGLQGDRKYTIVNLEAVTDKQMRTPMETATQFGEYYRDFTQILHYLKKQGRLNDMAISDKFIGGLDSAFRQRLRAQLHAEDPTHHPDDAYELAKIKKAALLVLSHSVKRTEKEEESPAAVKCEQFDISEMSKQFGGGNQFSSMAQFAQELFKYLPQQGAPAINLGVYQLQASNTVQTPPQSNSYPAHERPRSYDCVFCSDPGHYMYRCPKAEDYTRNGKCRRNPDNQIVLPNGKRLNLRVNPGRNLMERIDHWHNAQKTMVSTNLVTVHEADVAEKNSALVQAHFVWYEASDDEDEVCEPTPEEEEELRLLQLVVANMQKKIDNTQKKFGGGKRGAPITRSAAAKIDAQKGATAAKQGKPSNSPAVPTNTPTMAEAAVANAPRNAAGFTQPGNARNQASCTQFKYTTPIESSETLQKVTEAALDATVPMTVRDVLAISPDVRKVVREQINTKKVVNVAAANNKSAYPSQVGIVESFMAALPAHTDGKIVSNHSEKLRAIDVIIDGRLPVKAVMDEGSQIIGI